MALPYTELRHAARKRQKTKTAWSRLPSAKFRSTRPPALRSGFTKVQPAPSHMRGSTSPPTTVYKHSVHGHNDLSHTAHTYLERASELRVQVQRDQAQPDRTASQSSFEPVVTPEPELIFRSTGASQENNPPPFL
eukprot:scaffold10003_cov117-Isochrysis_galbana.AAC.10